MPDSNPKLFISYSRTSPEHEAWTLELATSLRECGVDVVFDKWDLKEGHDAYKFMEQMVSDPTVGKVAMICDHKYAEKADGRSGGVGTETQIISPEVYAKHDQSKFVAVITERDEAGQPCLPTFYKSRIYIDLSDSDQYAAGFEQLLRWVHDKPLYVKPAIGPLPAFLTDSNIPTLATTAASRRALDALRNQKPYRLGALREYLERLADAFEDLRIVGKTGEFDDQVIRNIELALPYRDEACELFLALAQYDSTQEYFDVVHRFLERLLPYLDRPPHFTTWRETDFDNYRFVVHELLLYTIASFLKYERFAAAGYLLRHRYYVEPVGGTGGGLVSFARFRSNVQSLHHRNERLKLKRLSLHADLLKARARHPGIPFRQIMQADFTLYLRDCLDSLREGKVQRWWPETLLYAAEGDRPFEIYARAQSKEFFESMTCLFDIAEKKELEPVIEAFKCGQLRVPSSTFESCDPKRLMGFEDLATRP